MSTNYDNWKTWQWVAAIGSTQNKKLNMEDIRPLKLSADVSITAPTLLQPIIVYRVKQGWGVVVTRIEAYVHSVNLQSTVSAFDVSAVISIGSQNGGGYSDLANSVRDQDYIFTFNPGDVMQLIYSEIQGPAVYRAFFRIFAFLVPQGAIAKFQPITTLTS